MWCELPPPKSILLVGSSPPVGPWSLKAWRFQAPLSWFILLWTPDNLPSEVLRSLWQGWSVRGYLSTPQLIGPGWTPDPNQANWVLCPGNPTLGPKGIDFKWQPSVLQCGGHRWRMRGGGAGWAGPSLSCQPLGTLSCSALSWVLVSLQRPLYLYHEHFHSLSLLPVVANLGRFLLLLITQIFVLL